MSPRVLVRIPDLRLEVAVGDITALAVDAVVNAANSTLLGGGGVDGAIHRAAGPELLADCGRLRAKEWPRGLPPGRAVATGAGRLKARRVIHTVGPVYDAGDSGQPEILAACYREALAVAASDGCRTVAFPAIATGAYGYPKAEAARIAWRAVTGALAATPVIEKVIFIFYSEEDARVFLEANGR